VAVPLAAKVDYVIEVDNDTSRAASWFKRLDLSAKVLIGAVFGVIVGIPAGVALVYLLFVLLLGSDEGD
jgi:hypothetical protein